MKVKGQNWGKSTDSKVNDPSKVDGLDFEVMGLLMKRFLDRPLSVTINFETF